MDCPKCKAFVDLTVLKIEQNAEEDGLEVYFRCPFCLEEFYAEFTPDDFQTVD